MNQATVGPGCLKVGYDKQQVKDAPSIGTDSELPAADEEAIFTYYGLTYQPAAGGARLLGALLLAALRMRRRAGDWPPGTLEHTGRPTVSAAHRGPPRAAGIL